MRQNYKPMGMFNNFLAAFGKQEPSPLYGKPLMYMIGAPTARAIPGNIVEPPYGWNIPGDDKIAYLNLFEQDEDGERPIDPNSPEWDRNLTRQFSHAAGMGFKFAELDNADAYSIGVVQEAITKAHSHGLGVIAKNPMLTNGAHQFMAHPNVFGVIVERDGGSPAHYDDLRKLARKDGLMPVWFVFDGTADANMCASIIKEHGFKGMGVTYSTGSYIDSHSVLLPVV